MHQLKVAIAAALMMGPVMASAADASSSVEARLKALEERQNQLEQQLARARCAHSRTRVADRQADRHRRKRSDRGRPVAPVAAAATPSAVVPATAEALVDNEPAPMVGQPAATGGTPAEAYWGTYEGGRGIVLARSNNAEVDFSVFTYVRYLNQLALDETYTDAFGRTKTLDLRNDVQLQKVMLYFKGWFMDPDFRYLFYAWTANTNMGQGAQVVLAGNLSYRFNEAFSLGRGNRRPAQHAHDQLHVPAVAARRQSHDRRRVLPRLLHDRHLGVGQALRHPQVPGHARQQPEPARSRCRRTRCHAQYRVGRPVVDADDG